MAIYLRPQALTLNPETKTKIPNDHCRGLWRIRGNLPFHQGTSWGIDPGVNFGLVIAAEEELYVYHGELIQETLPGMYGLRAFHFMQNFLDVFPFMGSRLVIEGAAYSKQFGQVKLQEVRDGFFLAAWNSIYFHRVQIIGPKVIRKVVLGCGTTDAQAVWVELNDHAAAALSMALYAAQERDV